MSDLAKILAENQKEMLKLLAPSVKNTSEPQVLENCDSEEENAFDAPTSTPIRSKTIAQNNTPLVSFVIKMFPGMFLEFTMFCKEVSLHIFMHYMQSSSLKFKVSLLLDQISRYINKFYPFLPMDNRWDFT